MHCRHTGIISSNCCWMHMHCFANVLGMVSKIFCLMKSKYFFIALWIAFVVSVILKIWDVPGSYLSSLISGGALMVMYFFLIPKVLEVPANFKKITNIYIAGIIWGYSMTALIFILNNYPGASIMTLISIILLTALIIYTLSVRNKFINRKIFSRVIAQSLLFHFTISFLFFAVFYWLIFSQYKSFIMTVVW